MLKDFRSQDLSIKRSPQKIIGSTGLPRRLKENNQLDTMGTLRSKWEVLTPVRDMCALGRTA